MAKAGCRCGWSIDHPDEEHVYEIASRHALSHPRALKDRPEVPHYTSGGIEPIDYIFAHGWGEGFCRGNVIKYVTRAGQKTGQDKIGDLEKAQTYIQFLIDREREGIDW